MATCNSFTGLAETARRNILQLGRRVTSNLALRLVQNDENIKPGFICRLMRAWF